MLSFICILHWFVKIYGVESAGSTPLIMHSRAWASAIKCGDAPCAFFIFYPNRGRKGHTTSITVEITNIESNLSITPP